MADHPMFADDLQEIVESFIVETTDILEDLDEDLLALEQNPADKDLIDKIFRAVHTIKGTAGFLSFEQLSVLAHHFESVLNGLRRDQIDFRAEMMDVMLQAFDLMK
ncbi:MAG: chemotaxis protein CheA, partial [Bacteroidetes bacterium]